MLVRHNGRAMPNAPATAQLDIDLYLHVRVLISMILGLSVTRLIGGAAGFIQHPNRNRIWLAHLIWVGWALLNVVTFWWWEFRLSLVGHWTFALYLFVLLYASMFYLLAVLLFPGDLEGYAGYEDYFLSRRVWFFGLMAVTEVLDVVDTWIKGESHFRSLGPEYVIRIGAFVVLCIVGARYPNPRLQTGLALAGLVYEVSFFARYFGSFS